MWAAAKVVFLLLRCYMTRKKVATSQPRWGASGTGAELAEHAEEGGAGLSKATKQHRGKRLAWFRTAKPRLEVVGNGGPELES
ncbi:hypothetical protein L7F22_029995 [Adiantum nelumboides]|nr:hypothetical protein [Adiantum nelumboides]